jgi:hypothetical protein
MPSSGRNSKRHSLQAGILKKCDEQCKMILYYSIFSCFNNFTNEVGVINIKYAKKKQFIL